MKAPEMTITRSLVSNALCQTLFYLDQINWIQIHVSCKLLQKSVFAVEKQL